ncbi:MAG: ATP synthase F1 subunit gamma [Kiritimatiellia bacterium]
MPTYREYNTRLASMGSMRRVTSTMKMVAASHLHRATAEFKRAELYGHELANLLLDVHQPDFLRQRLMAEPATPTPNGLLIVVSSNRGLCGAFNTNIIRAARRWTEAERKRFRILRAAFLGRKGQVGLRKEIEMRGEEPYPISAHPSSIEALQIAGSIIQDFMENRYDEVHLVFNRFVNPMVSHTELTRILPVRLPARPAGRRSIVPQIREPDGDRLQEQILKQWVNFQIFEAMLQSVACEHAARVVAMENATTNLRRLESELTLLRNRARQAAITKELAEIVGGAEALA